MGNFLIRYLLATTRFIETQATNLHLYALGLATKAAAKEQAIAAQIAERAARDVEHAKAAVEEAKARATDARIRVGVVKTEARNIVTAANAEADLIRTGARVGS